MTGERPPLWVLASLIGAAMASPDLLNQEYQLPEPCSIPENPDPGTSYPFFQQCTNNRCPPCTHGRPVDSSLLTLDRMDYPDNRYQPENRTLTSWPIFGGRPMVYQEEETHLLAESPPLRTSPPIQEACPSVSPWQYEPEVTSYQCPSTSTPVVVPRATILEIIQESDMCPRRSEGCRHTASELLLRLRFLLEKLNRPLLLMQTRYAAQAILLNQIKARIEEMHLKGPPGPPGDHGFRGTRGPRGKRGHEGKCEKIGRSLKRVGLPGPRGIPGPPGRPGDKKCGCDGAQGPPGYYGYTSYGYEGSKGHKGQKGPIGAIIDHYG